MRSRRQDAPHRALRTQRREQRERELGSEAAGAEQPLEHDALDGPVEAEQRPAVLLHHQLGVEADPPAGRGQPLGDAGRHRDRVADAPVGLHHDRVARPLGEHAAHGRDHRAPVTWRKKAAWRVLMIRWARATATPSAASAGSGGVRSRSSCATM